MVTSMVKDSLPGFFLHLKENLNRIKWNKSLAKEI